MTIVRRTLINMKALLFGYKFYGVKLKLPYNHFLPFIIRNHPEYSKNILDEAMQCDGAIIDIGANVGDTVAMLRSRLDRPILAIEADAKTFKYLCRNTFRYKTGEGKYITLNERVDAMNRLDYILEEHPDFKSAGFLKIDTDGGDIDILYGAEKYLSKTKPIIFFEYDPRYYDYSCRYVFGYLWGLGYKQFKFYANTGELFFNLEYPKDIEIISDVTHYCRKMPCFYFDVVAKP